MIQIALLALLPLALANGYGQDIYSSGSSYGGDSYGKSYEPSYPPQPYKFGYDVKDSKGSNLNQKEEGDSYGNKKGSYGYTDGYGIYRQVDYVADKNGFRATIKTNEPGTDNQNPADVYIQSNAAPVKYEESYGKNSGLGYGASYSAPSYSAPSYSAPSYSAPSYSAPKLTYRSEPESYGNAGGYASSYSIPAVAYARGY